jgi:hypothetical protein
MGYRELVKEIPTSKHKELFERLLDALLEAKEGGRVPSSLAKTILYYAQREQLEIEAGLTSLLEALTIADPEGVAAIKEEFGLEGKVK